MIFLLTILKIDSFFIIDNDSMQKIFFLWLEAKSILSLTRLPFRSIITAKDCVEVSSLKLFPSYFFVKIDLMFHVDRPRSKQINNKLLAICLPALCLRVTEESEESLLGASWWKLNSISYMHKEGPNADIISVVFFNVYFE